MTITSSSFTVDSAKQFLLSKIEEQACLDTISLDDIEKRMFVFSELSGTPDYEANEKFESEYDEKEYEQKISRLLRRSYTRDKAFDEAKAVWAAALDTLRAEDFYGLVMLDQAAIPRPKSTSFSQTGPSVWPFLWSMLPLAICELAVIVGGWLLVFNPSRLGLHLADWFRLLMLPVVFVVMWYVAKVFGNP